MTLLTLKDIARVYGYTLKDIKGNQGKTNYLYEKQQKCNRALKAKNIQDFRSLLDLTNQKVFDIVLYELEQIQTLKSLFTAIGDEIIILEVTSGNEFISTNQVISLKSKIKKLQLKQRNAQTKLEAIEAYSTF